jgi:hypothetical protein
MSLAPFLVVLLMELADSPGWVSVLFVLSTVSGQDHFHEPRELRNFPTQSGTCTHDSGKLHQVC